MEQVFRIEIPVEVKSNADLGRLQQVQAVLQKAEQEARRLATAADSAFSRIASGASNASNSMQQVGNAAQQSSQSLEQIGESAESAGDAAENAADSMEEIGDAAQSAGSSAASAFTGAEQSADRFGQRMERSQRTLREMFKEKLQMTLEAIDKVSPIVNEVNTKVKSLAAKAWKVTVKMADFVTAPFRALKNMIMSPITMTLSIAGIGLGASSFYQTFTEFEAGMSNVKALSGATNEEFIQLKETASDLGATTKFTAAQAAEGMQYLAMAGWDASDVIAGMPGLLQLAAAGGTDLGTAADIVSDVMTAMGMSASEASTAADIFARTATKTNTTIGMMGDTLKYAAPVAHSFGLQLSEVATVTGMMANAGIKGSSAGTAIRTALLRMASPSSEAAKAMAKLGLSFSDSSGKMHDMQTIMKDLGNAFSGLSEQEKLAYADDIFGKNSASAWLSVIEQGQGTFNELYDSIKNSKGAAQEMADIQLDNLAGDVTLLQSAVDGMKVSLMDKINPFLRSGVQWVTSKIPEITTGIGNLVDAGIAKAKELKDTISGVFGSSEFQNADNIADKLFIAWDKIIAEPFNEWWSGNGRDFALGVIKKIGGGFGEAIHGVIAGVLAALKGEEIDFEGLNLTGIGKAGAEAAREYVTAFTQGLNAPDLIGALPGGMKAGLIGFGALKLGSGALGIAKTVGALRLAFGGVTTAATTAATATAAAGEAAAVAGAGAAGGASAFGGLGSVLAAIPGWGWAALAALTAVGIGIKLYNDEQTRQRDELMHMGDAIEEAGDRYVKTAQRTRDIDATVRGIQEISVKVTTNAADNQAVIDEIEQQIKGATIPELVLVATLEDEGFNTEEAQTIIDQVKSAARRKAELEAKLENGNYDKDTAAEIEAQIAAADSDIAALTTALIDLGYDKDKVDDIITQIQTIASKDVQLGATLEASGYDPLQAAIIMAQFNAAKEEEKTVALILTQKTDMSADQIAALTTNLTELMAVREEKQIKLTGFGMAKDQIDQLKDKLTKIEKDKHEIEIAVAEGEGTPEMIQRYNELTAEGYTIQLQLEGSEMSEDEYNAITKQVKDIEEAVGNCTIKLSEDPNSELTHGDIDTILDKLSNAGDFTWWLGVNMKAGSLTTEDVEKYNQQLEEYAKHLEEITGGMVKAEDITNGTASDEDIQRAKDYAQLDESIKWNELGAEVLRGRENLEERTATRDQYKEQMDQAHAARENIDTAAKNMQLIQQEVKNFETADETMRIRNEQGEIDQAQYDTWRAENAVDVQSRVEQDVLPYATKGGYGLDTDMDALLQSVGQAGAEGLDPFLSRMRQINAEAGKTERDATENYTQANNDLAKQYTGERDYMTGEYTMGTQYAGMNIEELAASYATLDEAGKAAFENAYKGLQQLNEETSYISDAEKTQLGDVMSSAYNSVEAEAKLDVIDGMKTSFQDLGQQYEKMAAIGQGDAFDASHIEEINAALSSIGSDIQIDSISQIETALAALEGVDVDSIDFSTAASSLEKMGGNASAARSKVDTVRDAMAELDGKTADITINVHQNGSTNVNIPQQAEGGIFDGAMLSVVAEDGPEAIIPLGAKRRNRGLELWRKAGRALGVSEYAEGGILAPYADTLASLPDSVWDDDGNGSGDPRPALNGGGGGESGGNVIQVTVDVSPEYSIDGSGGDPEAILDLLREKQNELAELLGGAMAEQLADLISNM